MRIELTAWNVGHGEALRIDFENGLSVVRDFGRHSHAKPTSTSIEVDEVIAAPLVVQGRKTVAVLSHAHDDHFNGFSEMYKRGLRKVFRKCYIPWLDFRTVRSLGWQVQVLGTYLLAYYGGNSNEGLTTKHWSRAAPLMAALGRTVRGVAAGHRFWWPGPRSRVLWPPPPDEEGWRKKHRRSVSRKLRSIRYGLRRSEQGSVVKAVEESANAISRALRTYYDPRHPERSFPESVTFDDIKAIESRLEFVQSIPIRPTPELDQALSAATTYRRSFVDDHSLVFQIGHRALFLSDLNKGPMDLMARRYMPRAPRSYGFLKSAHHGTRLGGRPFRRAVRLAGWVLHCCGPADRPYRAPIGDYKCFAPECIISTDVVHPNENPQNDRIPRLYFGTQQMPFDL